MLSHETRKRLWRNLLIRSSDPHPYNPSLGARLLRYAATLILFVFALYLFAQL